MGVPNLSIGQNGQAKERQMAAYSLDLREGIVQIRQEGQSKNVIAWTFKVSLSTFKRYVRRFEYLGHVLPTRQGS